MEEIRTAWGTADESVLAEENAWAGVKPSINQIDVHREFNFVRTAGGIDSVTV